MIIVSFSFVSIVVVGLIFLSFFLQREHFLVCLLLLELISIVLVIGIPIVGVRLGVVSTPFFLILLTISACEARIGLSVIVYLVRSFGGDMLQSVRMGSL